MLLEAAFCSKHSGGLVGTGTAPRDKSLSVTEFQRMYTLMIISLHPINQLEREQRRQLATIVMQKSP